MITPDAKRLSSGFSAVFPDRPQADRFGLPREIGVAAQAVAAIAGGEGPQRRACARSRAVRSRPSPPRPTRARKEAAPRSTPHAAGPGYGCRSVGVPTPEGKQARSAAPSFYPASSLWPSAHAQRRRPRKHHPCQAILASGHSRAAEQRQSTHTKPSRKSLSVHTHQRRGGVARPPGAALRREPIRRTIEDPTLFWASFRQHRLHTREPLLRSETRSCGRGHRAALFRRRATAMLETVALGGAFSPIAAVMAAPSSSLTAATASRAKCA